MPYKIRDDLVDESRIDPKIGKPPPMATSLPRVVQTLEDGKQRLGDERIFMAGDTVPDEYVTTALRERLKDKDDSIHRVLEVVGDGEGDSGYSSWKKADLDAELLARGITIETGSGSGGSVTNPDRVAALEQSDATRSVEGQVMASGAPATTFNPFTPE